MRAIGASNATKCCPVVPRVLPRLWEPRGRQFLLENSPVHVPVSPDPDLNRVAPHRLTQVGLVAEGELDLGEISGRIAEGPHFLVVVSSPTRVVADSAAADRPAISR